jgi:hypothetical protein
MGTIRQRGTLHQHVAVQRVALGQRAGVPYQIVRTVCAQCERVLDERPVRRAAA